MWIHLKCKMQNAKMQKIGLSASRRERCKFFTKCTRFHYEKRMVSLRETLVFNTRKAWFNYEKGSEKGE